MSRPASSRDGQLRSLVDAMQCRTSALGGHWWECTGYGHLHRSFNSCHNQHCAELIGAKRWVFYRLQFRATARALIRRAADPWELLGGVKIGLVTVLHTWGQAMLRHIHSHVVLPGGGFSLKGNQWVSSPGREFFLDVARLADAYRDTYLRSLWRMYRAGELVFPSSLAPLADERAFRQFIRPLEAIRWVIDCGSPEHCHRPEAALDYLARYVVGSAISDARIVSDEHGQVTIRIKDYRQGAARDTISMPGEEFVRRFLMHVLPPRMARVRYSGFLGNRHRKENLERALAQLAVVVPPETEEIAITAAERKGSERYHAP